jgi:hypothetical protein
VIVSFRSRVRRGLTVVCPSEKGKLTH